MLFRSLSLFLHQPSEFFQNGERYPSSSFLMSQRKNSRDDHLLSKIVPKTEHPSLLKRKERELLQILPHLPNETNQREKEGGKG